jgi:hypothetical protein
VGVFDVAGVVLALDVVRDELHRARPVERDERHDLVDLRDVELAAERLHAAGFELEHADRLRLVEERERLRVLEADLFDVEPGQLRCLRTRFWASSMIVSVFRPRKSIFSRPSFSTGSLAYWVVRSPSCIVTGMMSVRGRSAMIMPARVLAGVAHHAFDDAAGLDDAGGLGVDADLLAKPLELLERVLERDVDVVGDSLARRLVSTNGRSRMRARSRTTILAPNVPKVMMLATRSSPYFLRT